MYFVKAFFVLAAVVSLALATPSVDRRAETGLRVLERQNGNDCNDYIGNCFEFGCVGVFTNPSDTIGVCTAGTYRGCPCEKCANEEGYIGSCSGSGCAGYQGTCTAGTYQGCPCV